jgi:hypothetical protein
VPTLLARLVLADASEEGITPVDFRHDLHAAGREGAPAPACSSCHHVLAEAPETIPGRCRSCHPMEPEEGKPPDL